MSVLLATLTLLGVLLIEGPSHHVQGIDVEGGVLWVTSVDRATRSGFLSRYDLASGRRLARVPVHDGERFHPGGIQIDGGSVWVPVAEYRRASSTWIQRRDKATLALIAQFEVADHIGCVAAANGVIWGGNWDSTHLYRWRQDGTLIDKRANPTGTKYQDIKIVEGVLVASGLGGPGPRRYRLGGPDDARDHQAHRHWSHRSWRAIHQRRHDSARRHALFTAGRR